jgi:hypothetical protein
MNSSPQPGNETHKPVSVWLLLHFEKFDNLNNINEFSSYLTENIKLPPYKGRPINDF